MPTEIYDVVTEGFIFGDWYDAGSTIRLNERQAADFVGEGRIVKATAKVVAKVKDAI